MCRLLQKNVNHDIKELIGSVKRLPSLPVNDIKGKAKPEITSPSVQNKDSVSWSVESNLNELTPNKNQTLHSGWSFEYSTNCATYSHSKCGVKRKLFVAWTQTEKCDNDTASAEQSMKMKILMGNKIPPKKLSRKAKQCTCHWCSKII